MFTWVGNQKNFQLEFFYRIEFKNTSLSHFEADKRSRKERNEY